MLSRRWTAMILWLLLVATATAADPAARITRLEREVSRKLAGQEKWASARPNDTLAVGDMVRTGKGARAEITYSDGTVARIPEATTLALTQALDRGWGRLLLGKIWLKALPGKRLRVVTPSATAAITGTELLLAVDDEQNTKIIVFEGSVTFTGSLGDSITVQGGQWGLARPETHLQPPQPAPLDEVRRAEPWINP